MKRYDAILKQALPVLRRAALLKQAGVSPPKARGRALLKMVGVAKRIPVPYYNRQGRQFFLTLKGQYVVRANGKYLYGVKAYKNAHGVIKNLSRVPAKIRPKRVQK
jgi:hypothetical protein